MHCRDNSLMRSAIRLVVIAALFAPSIAIGDDQVSILDVFSCRASDLKILSTFQGGKPVPTTVSFTTLSCALIGQGQHEIKVSHVADPAKSSTGQYAVIVNTDVGPITMLLGDGGGGVVDLTMISADKEKLREFLTKQ